MALGENENAHGTAPFPVLGPLKCSHPSALYLAGELSQLHTAHILPSLSFRGRTVITRWNSNYVWLETGEGMVKIYTLEHKGLEVGLISGKGSFNSGPLSTADFSAPALQVLLSLVWVCPMPGLPGGCG